MRLRAKVNEATGKTRHYVGALVDGRPVPVTELPIPVWVEISAEDAGVYLFRLDAEGNCLADSWHQTLEEARRQATFEYNIAPDEWTERPDQIGC